MGARRGSMRSPTLALIALLAWTSIVWQASPAGAQGAGPAKAPWQMPPVASHDQPTRAVRQVAHLAEVPQSVPGNGVPKAPAKSAPLFEPPDPAAPAPPEAIAGPGDFTLVGEPGACGACGDACACPSCDPCFPCFRPFHDRLWLNVDYLLWWTKGGDVPALVSGSADGQSNILFGNQRLNEGARSGVRFTLGRWLDPCESAAIEAAYFVFGQEREAFAASSPAMPILSRPYYDVQQTAPGARLLASPDTADGSIAISATRYLQGLDLLGRHNLRRECEFRADALFGYRFLSLDEDLTIRDSTQTLGTGTPTASQSTDVFHALSEFHGGELGVLGQWRRCRWSLDVLMKLALGVTTTRVGIDGSTTTIDSQGTQTRTGGLLAQRSNIQSYHQGQFAVVPELGVTLGYDLTCRLRATLGYTLLYWSNVARPGDQIDLDVDTSQFTGPLNGAVKPEFRFTATDLWAQGLSLGLDYRF